MKSSRVAVLIIAVSLLSPAMTVTAKPMKPSSFSALYRYWHEPSKRLLDEARLTYSPHGLRIEQIKDDSGNVFIANYAEDAFWFVDRKRHLMHAIPVVVSTVDTPMAVPEQNTGPSEFIQTEPCKGMHKVKLEGTRFQGRAVERWSCHLDGELMEEHWYASALGVVVRTSGSDGFVSELTQVQERDAAPAFFRPPSHYRAVNIEELINPAVPISSYEEKSHGQP